MLAACLKIVNGSNAGRADAMVISPLAYALSVPVLLTSADGLSEETAKFLADDGVEHVVVAGTRIGA